MGFNWENDDNDDVFRDMPDEVNGHEAPPSNVVGAARQSAPVQHRAAPVKAPVPELDLAELVAEEESEEDSENFEADANLRIELATLYKMIMNHDLFEGTDADPRAVEVVTRGIRKFAREQVEIMLGMRAATPKSAVVSSPFNDIEVMVLKKLASTYSKGATETVEANKPQPMAKAIVRKEGLNTIGGSAKAQPKPAVVIAPKKPLVQKAQAPVQRQVRPQEQVVESDYKPIGKPVDQMTAEEIIQRNKDVDARQASRKTVKSSTALPMPSPDQEAMFQEQRVMNLENPMANPNVVSAILSKMNQNSSQ